MGKTSNAAKQKWNSDNYAQIKVSVNPAVAEAFKNACSENGVSMAHTLSSFMAEYANGCDMKAVNGSSGNSRSSVHGVRTLRQRRVLMTAICHEIEDLISGESICLQNTPDNLQHSEQYTIAEERLASLEEVLDFLGGIYAVS